MIRPDGSWFPDLFPKQARLLEICRERTGAQKRVLLSGPKFSGKTISAANAIIDHCWNVDNASVAIIVPSQTVGEDAGFWELLTESIIPEWIAGEFGMDWAPRGRPRQKGTTKKLVCAVMNKYGNVSKIQLDSIKEERDVEKNFFNRYFSMIYVSEAALVMRKYSTYVALLSCFRRKGVEQDDYVYLLDTNPGPLGEDEHLYKTFYVLRVQNAEMLTPTEQIQQKGLRLLEIFLDDNPYLSMERKEEIKSTYRDDPELWARYGLGQWRKVTVGALFAGAFLPAIHLVGEERSEIEEILVPEPNCVELMTGWDFGPVNPVVEICEEFFCQFEADKAGDPPKELACFKFIDELAIYEEDLSLGDFTQLVCERMDLWEKIVGKQILWTHYSDRSAFDVKESIANIYQYQEVYAASNGRINLQPVDKRPGSVPASIRHWRRMLIQQRLLFSAQMCPKIVEMHRQLTAGKSGPIATKSIHKHPFDAGRYIITRRCWSELQDQIIILHNANRSHNRVISLPL